MENVKQDAAAMDREERKPRDAKRESLGWKSRKTAIMGWVLVH